MISALSIGQETGFRCNNILYVAWYNQVDKTAGSFNNFYFCFAGASYKDDIVKKHNDLRATIPAVHMSQMVRIGRGGDIMTITIFD